MKEWLKKYEFKKGEFRKCKKLCKYCGIEFDSNGPKEHCSWKCFLFLKRNIDQKGCWIWKGNKSKFGYGKTSDSKLLHRLSWEQFKGEIPKGKHICHVCDIAACYNPEHLFMSDHKGNMADCAKKGRNPGKKGEKHSSSILKEKDVIEIRKIFSEWKGKKDLAKKYNISLRTLYSIVNRENWKHV